MSFIAPPDIDENLVTTFSYSSEEIRQNSAVIIPTYNEAENINALIDEITSQWPELKIIFIDDNSPDGTATVIEEIKVNNSNIHLIHRAAKTGIGSAYRLGIKHALAQGFVTLYQMDADLSHAPADLLRMARTLEDASAVVGSRYVPNGRTIGWALRRKIISRIGSLIAEVALRTEVHDMTSGFMGYRASALKTLQVESIKSEGFAYQIEIKDRLQRSQLLTVEIPITFRERTEGSSKMHLGIITEAIKTVVKLRKRNP
jgi:dolichol-phosphate mannosyltransferase